MIGWQFKIGAAKVPIVDTLCSEIASISHNFAISDGTLHQAALRTVKSEVVPFQGSHIAEKKGVRPGGDVRAAQTLASFGARTGHLGAARCTVASVIHQSAKCAFKARVCRPTAASNFSMPMVQFFHEGEADSRIHLRL